MAADNSLAGSSVVALTMEGQLDTQQQRQAQLHKKLVEAELESEQVLSTAEAAQALHQLIISWLGAELGDVQEATESLTRRAGKERFVTRLFSPTSTNRRRQQVDATKVASAAEVEALQAEVHRVQAEVEATKVNSCNTEAEVV